LACPARLDKEAITDKNRPDRKRKIDDDGTEEAKKVKLMELASPTSSSSVSAASDPASQPAPASILSVSSSPSPSASGQAKKKKEGGKSLLGMLLSGERVNVGKGFRLFDCVENIKNESPKTILRSLQLNQGRS
jgi:hypothetical protein